MIELIREYQLDIMLLLCGACGILVLLLINTRFLSKSRRRILIMMEIMACLLLWFDRLAYIYAGGSGQTAFVMVRVSNFMVFFLTSAVVLGFNLYLIDLLTKEGKHSAPPKRLVFVGAMSVVGMLLAVVAAFTNLYYYFDETNLYHRGPGFLIAYIIPVLGPIIQYTVIRGYRKKFSKLIYISLVLYLFVPIICGIIQIFAYGISIVNMSMVAVSVFLYIFMYLDLNNTVEHAHKIEIEHMQGEQAKLKRVFDQTATAFVSAVEKKDDFTKGNSLKVAEYARRVAELAGKNEEDCEKVYYTALLHDVGLIGIPDNVIKNDSDPDKWDVEMMRKKPLIGAEILSSITEYPYLRQGAQYSHERYNGTGYPEGLKGDEIPEIARIIAVADAYVTMTTKKRYRDARPGFVVREAFVKGEGEVFDPVFAELMVKLIDSESKGNSANKLESEIECSEYRENVSTGVELNDEVIKISFDCQDTRESDSDFSEPSILLFDAYDGRTHDNKKAIKSYRYLEYGEVWFNKYSISTDARKIEEKITESEDASIKDDHYEITAGRYKDHLKLVMRSKKCTKEVVVALQSGSKQAFVGLTGEHCKLINITAEKTGERYTEADIPRIVEAISYIDNLESDIKNIQIDRLRNAYTEGIALKNKLSLDFHSMTLPSANLVWHCPYVVLYSSDDGSVGGENYHEYALIKINGENEATDEYAENRFVMKRSDDFPGWEEWKTINQKGLDCQIHIEKHGNRVVIKTENLGISIENTSVIKDDKPKVYVALTGDQVAITDIRKSEKI